MIYTKPYFETILNRLKQSPLPIFPPRTGGVMGGSRGLTGLRGRDIFLHGRNRHYGTAYMEKKEMEEVSGITHEEEEVESMAPVAGVFLFFTLKASIP